MIIGILPNVKSVRLNRVDECSFAHRQVEGHPSKKTEKNGDQKCSDYIERYTTIGLRISGHRAAGIFTEFTEECKSLGIISTSAIYKCYAASCKTSEKTKVCRSEKFKSKFFISAVRTLCKFEDRSQVETERQERCACGDAWRLAKNIYKLKEKDYATFFSPTNEWCLPAPSVIKLEEREFVEVSGALMHMLSRKDLNSAELETVRVSKSPTTVVAANGEVQTNEEATVYVKEFVLLVTVKLLEDTPAVLSLGKFCEDHGLPEGPKLRRLHEDQDNKGYLQKSHWHNHTSSREFW